MSEEDKTCLPLIIYYMRERYYRHAINTAARSLKVYNNDPVLRFFKAFATLMEGHSQEALQELILLKDHPHLSLCSTVALIYAHKHCETVDAVNELNSELKRSGSTAGERALYYAALIYWILQMNLKAKTCIKKMLKISETSPEGLIMKGWIVLTSDLEENRPQAIRYFNSGVRDSGNLFGLMGKIEFFMLKQNESSALDIIHQILLIYPDFTPALLMKMKIFMALQDYEQTEDIAHRVLERDAQDLKALQMLTVIAVVKDGDTELVKQRQQALVSALELREPCNPSLHVEITAVISRLIRDQFQFNLIKAQALLRSGDVKSAIQCLNLIMKMPGVQGPSEGPQSSIISSSERLCVFLQLSEALRVNGDQHEAAKVLEDAVVFFRGMPEETQLTLAHVDLALTRDDVDAAVLILQNILPTESSYIQAREKMAHIYLERRNDKKLFIACYKEITEQLPGAHTSILLADAFMKIHQPEEAARIYQEVETIAPKCTLTKKIGHALVKAHEYDKAVCYYETALRRDSLDCVLSLELSELLLKLKRFNRAQQVLEQALDHQPTCALAAMMNDVKALRVLVKVLRARDESALDVIQKMHDLQLRVIIRVSSEHQAELEEQKKLLSSICCDWAQEFHLRHELEKAKRHYTDALNHRPDDQQVLLHLAALYYEQQKLDYCEELCVKILQLQQEHTAAAMLFADTLYWKNQKEEAVKIYTSIMKRNPDNFHAMAKFLQILRRMGKLEDAVSVFNACEKFNPLTLREAGYQYCKGLYLWHSHQTSSSLTHLNKARGDADWGKPALEMMIHICLNPDKIIFGGEILDKGLRENISESENEMRMNTAHNLLRMFHPRCRSEQDKAALLLNECRIYSRKHTQVETAVLELADTLANNVMLEECLLLMAEGFVQLKQIPRARNFLKRLTRMNWSDTNADYMEKGCLLLADMYIKMGKYTEGRTLLHRCTQHNKSCSKAYEYEGFMLENEQRYRDAALQYELAWRHSRQPAVGYRLALNYLKSQNYTLAVDVCRQVLQQHPDYPQINTEILTRARLSLRL
ncbi:tetratricopeptide repeat protein 21A isoform X2 [Danio rerio]|uniref:Tetratricopeptide repeat protein 21A isoform X2 n=1 Tax=Danio rerio TaxID=7955 RepID=A0AC58ISW5_DANRE